MRDTFHLLRCRYCELKNKKKMSSEIQIINGGEARYLSELPEFQDGLPHGIVNKTKTDVGGTYVAANC